MAARKRVEGSEAQVFDAQWTRRAELFMVTKGELLGAQIPASSSQDNEKSPGSAWINHPVNRKELGGFLDPYHQACVQAKATCAVGLGMDLDKMGIKDASELPGNAFEGFGDIMNEVLLDMVGVGDGYAEVTQGLNTHKPAGLYWLPSATVEIHSSRVLYRQLGQLGKFSYFRAYGVKDPPAGVLPRDWGGGAWVDLHEILHFRAPGTGSTYYGEPDWLGCLKSVMLSDYARTWYADWFANGLKLGGIIGIGKKLQRRSDLTADERAAGLQSEEEIIQAFVRKEMVGKDGKAHSWLMLSGLAGQQGNTAKDALSLLPLSFTPSDTMMKNILDQGRNEIVTTHGVPRLLVSIETPGKLGGGSDAAGQLLIFETMKARRLRLIVESRLNATVGKDLGIKFAFKGIDKDFIQELVSYSSSGASGGGHSDQGADQNTDPSGAPTDQQIQAAYQVLEKAAAAGSI